MAEQTKMTLGQACVRGLSLTVGNPGTLLLGTLSESGISILSTCAQMAVVLVLTVLALGNGDGLLGTALSWKTVSPLVGIVGAVLALCLVLRGLWTGAAVRRFSVRLEAPKHSEDSAVQPPPAQEEPIAVEGASVFPRVAFFSAVFLPVLLAAFLVGATGIGGALLVAWNLMTGALESKWLAAFVIALGTALSLFVNKGAWMVFKAGLVRAASSDESPLDALLSGFHLLARRPFFFIGLFMLFAVAETIALWMADASGAGFATTQETLRSLPVPLILFLFVTSSVIAAAALVFVNAAEYGALTALSMEEQGRFVFENKPVQVPAAPAVRPAPISVTQAQPSPAGSALNDAGSDTAAKAAGAEDDDDDEEIVETIVATMNAAPPSPSSASAETSLETPSAASNGDEGEVIETTLAPAAQPASSPGSSREEIPENSAANTTGNPEPAEPSESSAAAAASEETASALPPSEPPEPAPAALAAESESAPPDGTEPSPPQDPSGGTLPS